MSAIPQFGKPPGSGGPDARQSQESQRMEAIGRLVSGVAHDFNNLLTGIVLCSDLLLARLEKDSHLRRYAQEIRLAGTQGAGLIQQLMAVARQRPTEPQVMSFPEAIRGMRDLIARLIGENIELITELADDSGLVKMDPAQAQQIVLNLVLNARDAMPEGGRIQLSTRGLGGTIGTAGEGLPLAGWVELEVCDTGCGMDAETRARAFEPFFTTKKPGKGTGLGLATVFAIVEQHQGTIKIESEPGKGTRVILRLPGAEPEAKPFQQVRTQHCQVASQSATAPREIQQPKRGKRS